MTTFVQYVPRHVVTRHLLSMSEINDGQAIFWCCTRNGGKLRSRSLRYVLVRLAPSSNCYPVSLTLLKHLMDSSNSSKELLNLDGQLEQHGVHIEDDNKICWNEANQDHPRNWGVSAKTYSTLVICWLELYMTGISSSGVCFV